MQKIGLHQTLSQKLSPQQIQFIKLLQISTTELESRIEKELENNPALDEGKNNHDTNTSSDDVFEENNDADSGEKAEKEDSLDFDDYVNEDYSGYKMYGDGREEQDEVPIASNLSFSDFLTTQLSYCKLDEKEYKIGQQLVGSIEEDGYIRRELKSITYDLAFSQGMEVKVEEVEKILHKIQEQFDPPGIAARNLQECLLLQLERKPKDEYIEVAIKILTKYFDDFTKKHFQKIQNRMSLSAEEFKKVIESITKLNPKPSSNAPDNSKAQYIVPDFILVNNNGTLELSLNRKNTPELKISRSYSEIINTYKQSKNKDRNLRKTVSFIKQKLDAAKWFIDAINQRNQTLLITMQAIIDTQYDFFISREESKLKPMILKDIANKINMDVSTASRVVNSKFVQTEFGIFSLKYFFSESLSTDEGKEVSTREIKHSLKKIIDTEDKRKPYSDDKLTKILQGQGYNIARRTVTKYREQFNIPVARLRKEA